MYCSITLDALERRHPPCTQHAAGVARLIEKTAHVVQGHALHILTTHTVVAYVDSAMFTMTSLRQIGLHKVLTAPNLTFHHEGINMADGITSGPPHECEEVARVGKVRADLKAEPLEGGEVVFTDGCCYRDDKEGLQAAWAVVRTTPGGHETVSQGKVQEHPSAQKAEVLAVIAALRWGEGKCLTIYTDSAYACTAAHVELGQWERAGFLTAGNKPIKHETEMKELARALHLPKGVAIVKCKGHDPSNSSVAKGNDAADAAAKKEAGYESRQMMVSVSQELAPSMSLDLIMQEQQKEAPEVLSMWKYRGGTKAGGLWRGPQGRLALPSSMAARLLDEAHGVGHVGHQQMYRNLCHWWHPFLPEMTKEHVKACAICVHYNPKPTVKPHMGKFPLDPTPGKEIVIDYTDMGTKVSGFQYLLVCVDAFTGWPEAWPAKREDAKTVIKCLVNHYIPRHGFPRRVRSDNGSHFKNKDLNQVEGMLGLKHKFGTVYHPQSQGKVERMNSNIKQKIGKITATTGLNWVDALPLALMSIRFSVNQGTGFTPYELWTGRQFPAPLAGTNLEGYHFDQDTSPVAKPIENYVTKRDLSRETL